MCTASDMRIYKVDIQPKTRYNMPDNKQGWNITLEYLMFCAGVAQWQSVGFPSRSRGFDSHHPLGIYLRIYSRGYILFFILQERTINNSKI